MYLLDVSVQRWVSTLALKLQQYCTYKEDNIRENENVIITLRWDEERRRFVAAKISAVTSLAAGITLISNWLWIYEASTVEAKKKSELGKTFRKPHVPDLASVAGASLFRAKENLEAHRNYTPYSLTKKQYLPIIYYTLVCVCSPSPS